MKIPAAEGDNAPKLLQNHLKTAYIFCLLVLFENRLNVMWQMAPLIAAIHHQRGESTSFTIHYAHRLFFGGNVSVNCR